MKNIKVLNRSSTLIFPKVKCCSCSDYEKDAGLTDPETEYSSRNELEAHQNSWDPEPGSRLDKALDHLINGNERFADDDPVGAAIEWSRGAAQVFADSMDKVNNKGGAGYIDNTGPSYPFQTPDLYKN